MHMKQFDDTDLTKPFTITNNNGWVLVDPTSNPGTYQALVRENHAKILGTVKTHSHANQAFDLSTTKGKNK